MKKYLLLVCLPVLFLFSCKKESVHTPSLGKGAVLTLLRVDAATNTFTGGKTYNYETYYATDDKIPVGSYMKRSGDSGFLAQVYTPSNDTVFYGGMRWDSTGQLWYPAFDPMTSFRVGGAAVDAPAYSAIQQLMPAGTRLPDFTLYQLWQPVATLAITQQYMQRGDVKVGLFLYSPSPGDVSAKNQSWVWVLYKSKD